MKTIELAKWLHDNYEEIAREKKWNTQENCKVEFNDLPKSNKQTMISLADRIITNFLKPNESKTINRNEFAEKVLKDYWEWSHKRKMLRNYGHLSIDISDYISFKNNANVR